jgi:hypothetical protein
MKKILTTLVLIVACAAGTVFAQPRHHGYYGGHYGGPHHGYVHYGPAPYYHGSIGSFILGAAIGAVVDHAITKAATRPVVVERTVVVDKNGDPIDAAYDPIEEETAPIEVAPEREVVVVERKAPVVIVRSHAPVMIFDDYGFHFETHPHHPHPLP